MKFKVLESGRDERFDLGLIVTVSRPLTVFSLLLGFWYVNVGYVAVERPERRIGFRE